MTYPSSPPILPPGTKLEKGKMYARLFHGRNNPEEVLQTWGLNGPVFGPLANVSLTYLQHLRLLDEVHDGEVNILCREDLLPWQGRYYGDLQVFVAEEGDKA